MYIRLHQDYARIRNGDWTVQVMGHPSGDTFVIARTLRMLQVKGTHLRNLGYQVRRTAFQQYGHGVDSWQRPHYNAV